jgi:hypothetical protein
MIEHNRMLNDRLLVLCRNSRRPAKAPGPPPIATSNKSLFSKILRNLDLARDLSEPNAAKVIKLMKIR